MDRKLKKTPIFEKKSTTQKLPWLISERKNIVSNNSGNLIKELAGKKNLPTSFIFNEEKPADDLSINYQQNTKNNKTDNNDNSIFSGFFDKKEQIFTFTNDSSQKSNAANYESNCGQTSSSQHKLPEEIIYNFDINNIHTEGIFKRNEPKNIGIISRKSLEYPDAINAGQAHISQPDTQENSQVPDSQAKATQTENYQSEDTPAQDTQDQDNTEFIKVDVATDDQSSINRAKKSTSDVGPNMQTEALIIPGNAALIDDTNKVNEKPLNEVNSIVKENRFSLDEAEVQQSTREYQLLDPLISTEELIKKVKDDNSKSNHEKQLKIVQILAKRELGFGLRQNLIHKKNDHVYKINENVLKQNNSLETIDHFEVERTRIRLEQTLTDYKIQGKVVGVQKGPIITMYEIQIAAGVKVSSMMAIQDEIKMTLELKSVRVVAPIPGRNTIGVEIPNKKRSEVLLGDLIRSNDFKSSNFNLPVALGKDITGNKIYFDLHKLPHILIAGATGSGKSVCINNIILSLLFKFNPAEVRMILIDPKVVELQLYNDIPHLLLPVMTDAVRATKALAWCILEMERRYTLLSALNSKDILSYNEKVKNLRINSGFNELQPLPFIVIVIDELGDLMMISGKEVESYIIRLTQKARAVGIHLVMATQRPSVDVITALIKANCPARIALKVVQKTDSRTILDISGADTLLGQGDLLYRSPLASECIRVQAPFVSEIEVQKIVADVKSYGKPDYIEINFDDSDSSIFADEKEDELYNEAWQIIINSGKASASFLQRRLKIGYNRAATIIEFFEDKGYIGPQIGAKPREILKNS